MSPVSKPIEPKPIESFYTQLNEKCHICHVKLCKCQAHKELERRGWKLERSKCVSYIYDIIFPNGVNIPQVVTNILQGWNLILRLALVVQHGLDRGDEILFNVGTSQTYKWDISVRFYNTKHTYPLFRIIDLMEGLVIIQTLSELHNQLDDQYKHVNGSYKDHSWLNKSNVVIPNDDSTDSESK